jgi:hypothetical protein
MCNVSSAGYLLRHDLESLSDAATWRLRKRHYFTDCKFGCLNELVQPWWDSLHRYSSARCQIFRETLAMASLHEAIHSLKLAQTSLTSTLWGVWEYDCGLFEIPCLAESENILIPVEIHLRH